IIWPRSTAKARRFCWSSRMCCGRSGCPTGRTCSKTGRSRSKARGIDCWPTRESRGRTLGGNSALTTSVIVVLAAGVVALGAWALWLRLRAQRLGQQLAEANEQLARVQKLGALGEMAASFAHAFNDVLTPIIGRTQLLTQRITDPQLREWLTTIERSALGGAQTVKRIQAFMRLRRDEASVPVDLGAVVKQALAVTGTRQRPSVRIETDLAPVPPVSGDPLGLREAFGHLIANALESVPEKGTVRVSTRIEDGQAVVAIVDTGTGMAGGAAGGLCGAVLRAEAGAPRPRHVPGPRHRVPPRGSDRGRLRPGPRHHRAGDVPLGRPGPGEHQAGDAVAPERRARQQPRPLPPGRRRRAGPP